VDQFEIESQNMPDVVTEAPDADIPQAKQMVQGDDNNPSESSSRAWQGSVPGYPTSLDVYPGDQMNFQELYGHLSSNDLQRLSELYLS
jgi:hypothetical protein